MMPTRLNCLVSALLGVMLTAVVDHTFARDASAPPNIVLISTDDQHMRFSDATGMLFLGHAS